jgi:hypothetical protein
MKRISGILILVSVLLLAGFSACKTTGDASADAAPAADSSSSSSSSQASSAEPATGVSNGSYNTAYSGAPREGVYLGIVSFGPEAFDLTGGPIFLDENGKDVLLRVIDHDYQRASEPGTALYYAVHKALAGISANADRYPDDILGSGVLTFTDGLDTSSTFLRLPAIEGQRFSTDVDYQQYLESEFRNRQVNSGYVYAASLGVESYDVVNASLFQKSLESIADPGYATVLDNFESLRPTFEGIADMVEVTLTNATGKLSVTGFPVDTVIRMTFDLPLDSQGNAPAISQVDGSRAFVEGVLALNDSGDGYVFKNIKYSGVTSGAGTSIPGVINGNVINFTFDNVNFFGSAVPENILQWYKNESTGNVWQFNTEYLADQDIRFVTVKKSVVGYLVLDCSTSLSDDEIASIKDATKAFVEQLYDKVKDKEEQ